MERIVIDKPRQKDRIHLLGIELRHVVEAAVAAQLRHRPFGQLPSIRLGHHVGIESAGCISDIDDAGLQRIADFKRRHRLRPADIVDLDDALAFGIDEIDKPLETARVGRLFRKGGHRLERDLLRARPVCQHGHRRGNQKCAFHRNLPERLSFELAQLSVGGVPLSNGYSGFLFLVRHQSQHAQRTAAAAQDF